MDIKEIQKIVAFIDSDKASIKLSNDDVFIDIPNRIMNCVDDSEFIEVILTEFSCNRNFYSVNDNNNRFSIYYNGLDHFYTIDNGFPNVLDLDTQLKTDLENEFSGETFTIQFRKYDGKIIISSTFVGSVPSDLALNFDVENTCAEVFGFTATNHNFNIQGQVISLSSDKSVNVAGNIKEIYIRSSLVNDNLELSTDGLVNSDVLGKIPILVSPLSVINFFDNGNGLYKQRLSTSNLTGFNLRLTDENNNLINLNSNFLITLTFIKYRKVEDEKIKILKNMYELDRLKLIKEENKL